MCARCRQISKAAAALRRPRLLLIHAPRAKTFLHPRIGFVNKNTDTPFSDFQVRKTLAEQVINVPGAELPTSAVTAFVGDVCRWLRLARSGFGRA